MSTNTPNTPAFFAYAVKDGEKGRKAIWTRIGAAWRHQESGGINLILQAVPVNFLDGKIVLMPPKPASDEAPVAPDDLGDEPF